MGLVLILLFLFAGIGAGIITGLVPGFHINTMALIVVSIFSNGIVDGIYLAVFIIANLITHTFLDFIPSTFIGAPDESTALSVLPAHRMLLSGSGYDAVVLATWGSLIAVLISISTFLIFQILLVELNLYSVLKWAIPLILFTIILSVLYLESEKSLRHTVMAAGVFLLSGIFGYAVLSFSANGNFYPFPYLKTTFLFPVFTGMFGLSTLWLSRTVRIPPQKISKNVNLNRKYVRASLAGTFSGALVGFLPGVTSGIAAVLSRMFFRDENEKSFICAMGSVNTANALYNMLALFIILRPRSEAIDVISQQIFVTEWGNALSPPSQILLFILVALVAAVFSYFITLKVAAKAACMIPRMGDKYGKLSVKIMIFLCFLIFIFTGFYGLIFAAIAFFIGLLPPKLGIMRVHLMGVIIFPVLIYYL